MNAMRDRGRSDRLATVWRSAVAAHGARAVVGYGPSIDRRRCSTRLAGGRVDLNIGVGMPMKWSDNSRGRGATAMRIDVRAAPALSGRCV